MMTKVLFFLLLLIGAARRLEATEVCVRPIYPGIEGQVQTVVNGLQKKGIRATVCGEKNGVVEVWFYPLATSGYGETFFFVNANRIPGGVVGTVNTYRPYYTGSDWVLSIHLNGGVESLKRVKGYSLKSQSGRLGKWLRKII